MGIKNKLQKLLVIFAVALTVLNSSGAVAFAREPRSAREATPVQDEQPTADQTEPVNPPTEPTPPAPAVTNAPTQPESIPPSSNQNALAPATTDSIPPVTPGTGSQNQSGAVGDPVITTGDATAAGTVINTANTTTVNPAPNSCNACVESVQATNSGNGTGSDNNITVDNSATTSATVDNHANVANSANFDAVTGKNKANDNVGSSTIGTGDANIAASMITAVNETGLGLAEFNIVDNHVGDIILTLPQNSGLGCSTCNLGTDSATNTGNGAQSNNNIDLKNSNNNNTLIDNNADIVSTLNLKGDTGRNEASKNTGGDNTITTGDVNVAASLINLANSTIFGGAAFVVNVFGSLVGDIIFPSSIPSGAGSGNASLSNTGNGANSNNLTNFTNTNNNNINLNNNASVENNLNINGNTGDNQTNSNTGGNNTIDTGKINVNAEVINVVNTNVLDNSAEPLWLILVNNMGTWTGQIVGSLTGQNYAGSGFTFSQDPTGELTASNTGNGAGSNNAVGIANTNTNNFSVNNDANVINNININANTGGNKANDNTGGNSSIKTGNINVAASVINFINTNLIGRNIMLGIINVFGSWTGNAIPPGHEKLAVGGASENSSSTQNNSTSSNGDNGGSQGDNTNSNSGNAPQVLGSTTGGGNSSSGTIASLFQGSKTTTGNTGSSDSQTGGGNSNQFNSIIYAKSDSGFWKNQYLLLLIPLTAGTLSVLLRRRFAQAR